MVQQIIKEFKATGQESALYAVVRNSGISQTEIARISIKDKANVTHIIDFLEEKGYIKRVSDHKDRRVNVIVPISGGEEVLERLIGVAQASNEAFVQDLTASERQSLKDSLRKISASLEDMLADR
ncbi:MAG: transcriptional repressor MprA [Methanosaeta sp. PtaU1.Bin060]|nr:MAG: transcriptional repressor MprA [Methanosaeta sp. PtaU1.Bin060]